MRSIIIAGGGITGLAAALIAAKAGHQVRVLEAADKFGGLLNTFGIGGERLEYYYHHFFTHDAELHWLLKELGLEDKLFYKKTSMGVFRDGKIYDFNGPGDLLKFKPLTFTDKIRFGLSTIFLGRFAGWKNYENVSAAEWLEKWAGKSTAKALWLPLLNIKFGPYAKEVPLSWMVGRMRQRFNSRKNGDERLGYLEGSLQLLLDALLEKLKSLGVQLISNAPVIKIETSGNKIIKLQCPDNSYSADDYLFTIPGIYLADLLAEKAPETSKKLAAIKYFGAVCVILELKAALSHVYWLNVADEGYPFGGVIEHSNFIPAEKYAGSHIVYLSRYFAWEEDIANMSDTEIKNLMIPFLKKIYPNFSEELIKNVFVFKTKTAAPVCDFNFSEKIPTYHLDAELDNLFVCNMSHVYPDERGVNNSVCIAAQACRAMGIESDYLPKSNAMAGILG